MSMATDEDRVGRRPSPMSVFIVCVRAQHLSTLNKAARNMAALSPDRNNLRNVPDRDL